MVLSPSFNADVVEYTAGTSNDADKVTATADASLTISIKLNDETLENGSNATWEDGENTLEITVTNSASEKKVYEVTVTKAPVAALSGLTIGALTLSPTFSASTTTYTTGTINNSNKVTATADEDLDLEIKLGDTEIENESSPTWTAGDNVLTIKVSNVIGESKTYTVTVTKAPAAKLSGLTIGSLELTPSFDADVDTYTTATTNETDTVTATAAEGLTIALELNDVAIENESAATWGAGSNTLVVTVSNAIGNSEEYTVTVTKS